MSKFDFDVDVDVDVDIDVDVDVHVNVEVDNRLDSVSLRDVNVEVESSTSRRVVVMACADDNPCDDVSQ